MAKTYRGEAAFEDTPYTILARLCARVASGAASPVETEGKLIQQADVTSVTCKVYDSTGALVISTTPTVSDVIYNTLQTSQVFAKVSQGGGNFLYQIPATGFPTGATSVTVELTVTLTTGEPVRAVWIIPVINLNQS